MMPIPFGFCVDRMPLICSRSYQSAYHTSPVHPKTCRPAMVSGVRGEEAHIGERRVMDTCRCS